MPIRKIQKKRRARPRRYTRRRKTRTTAVVSRTVGFPDRIFTTLNYSELFALTYGGAGVPRVHQFMINNLYDPNFTGTGHQPLCHDQYAQFYLRYRVYGMRYKITFTNQETASYYDIAVQKRPNTSAPSLMEDFLESPYVQRGTLDVKGSGGAIRTMSGYASVAKLRGLSKKQVTYDEDLSALIGVSPTQTPSLNIIISNQNTLGTGSVNIRVQLTFYVCFYDRKFLTQS